MIAFLWNCMVCAIAITGASKLLPGVRCDSFGDAFKVSVLYALFAAIIGWFAVWFGLGALVVSNIVPVIGPIFVLMWMPLLLFLVCAASLYLADQVVEGFEIQGVGLTLLTAFVIGLLNIPLSFLTAG